MTSNEAFIVAMILTEADGGCPTCVHKLLDALTTKFPEHVTKIEQVRHAFDRERQAQTRVWERREGRKQTDTRDRIVSRRVFDEPPDEPPAY